MTVPPFVSRSVRGRLLLVEDTSVLREIQVLLLRSAGYEATSCCETTLATTHVEQHHVDLVILNSDRPEMFSPAFIDALRCRRPNLPILALVGGAHPTARRVLQLLGVSHIADRPLHPAQLLQEIDGALGQLSPSAPKHYMLPPVAEPQGSRHGAVDGTRRDPQLPFGAVSLRVTDDASVRPEGPVVGAAESPSGG